ncbi:MAG: DUF1631 domain-containing protein [Kangiellaceae bacterium]|nr:DUF1631 domain-containing protein [Kangiellaceae bacterium]
MSSRDHIVHFSSKNDSSAEYRPLPVLLKNVQSEFVQALEVQLVSMLDTADDRLFDMSETSYNNAQFDAMRLLRVKREGLISRFKQELINNFKQTLGKIESGSAIRENVESLSFENIALVKDDDLEEDIATDTMINKARTKNQEALENIRIRIDTLVADKSIDKHNNPFEPVYVCDAFRHSTQALDLDITSLLIIYKLFDRSVISELETVYQKVNLFFIEKGILPDLRTSAVIKRSASTSSSHNPSSQNVIDSLPVNESEEVNTRYPQQQPLSVNSSVDESNVLSVIQQLLAGQRGSAQIRHDSEIPMLEATQGNAVVGGNAAVETNQLVQALSSIQVQHSNPVDLSFRPDVNSLKQTLGQQLPNLGETASPGALGQFNEDMIDIVSMLFDFILEDDNLQPELKSVIGRLQIPMLKVGLVDETFFSNRRHPARVLLNELARAGLSWDKTDPSAVPMYKKICEVAEHIIQNFTDDTSLFGELLQEFTDFKQKHQQRANIFERRTKEAEEGKAKTESARSEVNHKLTSICKKHYVPEVVKTLLKNVWAHAMLLERLKDNKDAWNRRVKVAKLLVWSVQSIDSADRLEKLMTRVPILVKSLREGMELISFSSIESTHLLEKLESAHRDVIEQGRKKINQLSEEDILRLPAIDLDLRGLTDAATQSNQEPSNKELNNSAQQLNEPVVIEPVMIDDIGFTKAQTGESTTNLQEEEVEIDSHVSQTVEQLRAGSWVELELEGEFKRSKLAARIASSGKFIFVNRNGMKMAEFLTDELCQFLQLGKLKILDDEALFDRALESVISNLRSMKAHA